MPRPERTKVPSPAPPGDDDNGAAHCKEIYEPNDIYFKNVECSFLHKNVKSLECHITQANKTTTYCIANAYDMCCEPDPLPAYLTASLSFVVNVVLLLLVCRFCKRNPTMSTSDHAVSMRDKPHDPLLRGRTGLEGP